VLGEVNGIAGVESAAISINLPMDRNMRWDVAIPGQPPGPANDGAFARIVSPGYFRSVGIPVVAGRDFDDRDREKTALVVAVNETLARRVGPNPIGRTITLNGRDREIIAVVRDVKHRGLDAESGQEFYVSYLQTPGWQTFDLVVRATDPSALVPAVRAAIQRVDSEQAVGTPVPLQQLIDRTTKPRRLLSWLLGAFAATALVLAALGVYGIVGYRVARRTKENALRVALGATQWRVMSRVFADALATSAIGILVGIPLALKTGDVVQGFLFGITPQDPTAFIGGLVALLVITIIGACIPARRAARVDVMTTLRLE
jgi:ABC-type antimicrobial peptide transport system permease subunit